MVAHGYQAFLPPPSIRLMAAHPDKIRLVLRHAPFHRGSDKVVAVLETAHRQGMFWPALDALFANQGLGAEPCGQRGAGVEAP